VADFSVEGEPFDSARPMTFSLRIGLNTISEHWIGKSAEWLRSRGMMVNYGVPDCALLTRDEAGDLCFTWLAIDATLPPPTTFDQSEEMGWK